MDLKHFSISYRLPLTRTLLQHTSQMWLVVPSSRKCAADGKTAKSFEGNQGLKCKWRCFSWVWEMKDARQSAVVQGYR